MAVVGHWMISFLLAYIVPDVSATLLCKLVMFADFLSGFLVFFRVERISIYARWIMTNPPPATKSLIHEWQKSGKWDASVDFEPRQHGFDGFGALVPFYSDLSWSHSAEFMLELSIPFAVFMLFYYHVRWQVSMAIVAAAVSHPLLDMLFHDAHIFKGSRTESKYSLALWQNDYLIVPCLVLELLMAVLPYQLWLRRKWPAECSEERKYAIQWYQRMFWVSALGLNQFSWYVLNPALAFIMYRYHISDFEADNLTTRIAGVLTMCLWTCALYPLHMLEVTLGSSQTYHGVTCSNEHCGVGDASVPIAVPDDAIQSATSMKKSLSMHGVDDLVGEDVQPDINRSQSVLFARTPQFLLSLSLVLVVASGIPIASVCIWHVAWIDAGPAVGHGSSMLQVLLCGPMFFLLITHCRALQYVPEWTKKWNINVDFGTSLAATVLQPNAWGIAYVLMHGAFYSFKFIGAVNFRALFRVRDILWSPIYYFATLFEMLFQLNHIWRHGSSAVVPILLGMLAFAVVWREQEIFEKQVGSSQRTNLKAGLEC